jgi:hypothetical protein
MSLSPSGAAKRRGGKAAKGPTGATLGKYTKSATPPSDDADSKKLRLIRAERYELLSVTRALFLHEGKREGLDHPHDWHRTAKCRYVPVAGAVGIHKPKAYAGAFYSGLMLCGSVWSCPVCAAKVQERRREEIAQAIAWAYDKKRSGGLQPVMVTLTFPHRYWHQLLELLAQQADALHRLRAGAPWSRFKQSIGYQGLIRSLELTIGGNGWHPHTHEIWFVSKKVKAEAIRQKILERWKKCCVRAGLLDLDDDDQVAAFEAHAVDVKGWVTASDYLAKQDDSRHWGVDREMAKGSTKAGKKKGKHPFRLLALAAEGDKKAGAKFVEYAAAMKGKRQIFWSAGLKAKVGIEDQTDESLAEEQREEADLLGLLELDAWKLVRAAGKRAELLDAAETGGWEAVRKLVESLRPVPVISVCSDTGVITWDGNPNPPAAWETLKPPPGRGLHGQNPNPLSS